MVIFHRYVTYVSLPEGNSTTSKGRKTGFWGCRLKTKLSWNVSGETTFKATVFLLCNLVLPRDAGTWHVSHHFERTSSCTVTTPLWNRITKRTYHTHTYIYMWYIHMLQFITSPSSLPGLPPSLVYSRMASETVHIPCFTSLDLMPFALPLSSPKKCRCPTNN